MDKQEACEVRAERCAGLKLREIASRHGTATSTISRICTNIDYNALRERAPFDTARLVTNIEYYRNLIILCGYLNRNKGSKTPDFDRKKVWEST